VADRTKQTLQAPTVELATQQAALMEGSKKIGQAVVSGLDVEGLCYALKQAKAQTLLSTSLATDAENAQGAAFDALLPRFDEDRKTVQPSKLLTSNEVKARLPLFLGGTPPALEIRRFEVILDLDSQLKNAALQLELVAPDLAEILRDLADAKPEAKKALRDQFRNVG
jgi:hypothetical protein